MSGSGKKDKSRVESLETALLIKETYERNLSEFTPLMSDVNAVYSKCKEATYFQLKTLGLIHVSWSHFQDILNKKDKEQLKLQLSRLRE